MIALYGIAGSLLLLPSQLPEAPKAKPLVYQLGGEVVSPKLIYSVDPEFTEAARKDRVQGKSLISLVVDAEGRSQDVRVSRSLTLDADPKYRAEAHDLDDEAVKVVRQYRWRPGTLHGKAVAVAIEFPVNFQLF